MQDINERPICHRAEDLVTYLYDEASENDARDFVSHVERCDACRAELAVFQQVHKSILLWRSEALGSAVNPATQSVTVHAEITQLVQHARKLSALAALRQFFSVSPLWLRGATAFAALLLCMLALLGISRLWQQPSQIVTSSSEQKVFTRTEFQAAVKSEVEKQVEEFKKVQEQTSVSATVNDVPQKTTERRQSSIRSQLARLPQSRLTRQEREQLAADLRLIPGRDEEELPFVLTDEPNK